MITKIIYLGSNRLYDSIGCDCSYESCDKCDCGDCPDYRCDCGDCDRCDWLGCDCPDYKI